MDFIQGLFNYKKKIIILWLVWEKKQGDGNYQNKDRSLV